MADNHKTISSNPVHQHSASDKYSRALYKIATFIFIMACFGTVTSFIGKQYWFISIWSHFKVQYIFALLLVALVFIYQQKFKLTFLSLIFCFFNAMETGPYYWHQPANVSSAASKLELVSINILAHNKNYNKIIHYINKQDPDIVGLSEFQPHAQKGLKALINQYPYKKLVPREDHFGIALLSKKPLNNIKVMRHTAYKYPSILADFKHQEEDCQILVTHPKAPLGYYRFNLRNQQYQDLKANKEKYKENFILMGDLNSTAYSPYFKDLANTLNLQDSRKGFGLKPTWPSFFWPVSISIDHCLISQSFKAVEFSNGPYVGSDHYPIYTSLVLDKE